MSNQNKWLQLNQNHSRIVFFDGVCGICNRFVDFLLKLDRTNSLQFAPLQGKTAREQLDHQYTSSISTIIYKENNKVFTKSCGAIRALASLGGMYKFLFVLLIVPTFIRDFVYTFIAKNRYSWFGKYNSCRIPSSQEKNRILL